MKDINIKKVEFYCDEDLSQYTDSLLFDSDEDIAGLKMYDTNDNCVELWLTVRGEKDIFLLDENGDVIEDERYKYAREYSQKMIDAIKNGTDGIDYACNNNNWFEVLYSHGKGDKLIGDNGEVWDGFDKQTAEQLKSELSDFAKELFEQYYDRGIFERPETDKGFTIYKVETSYAVDSITAISNKPETDGRYKFFQYLPVDICEEPIVKAELITPEMRDKFIALYKQYESGDYEETPVDYTDGEEWAANKEEIYLCDGYQDICNALSDKDFFAFIKDSVCKERNFEEDLKEYIADRHSKHYDVGDALYAAEQLGFKDLADSTRQMLKGKDPQIERE